MKIGIAQINTTTGDFEGNCGKILEFAGRLKSMGADMALFPELALCGPLPKDRAASARFLEENERRLGLLARELPIPAAVGFVRRSGGAIGAFNSLAWLEGGKARAFYDKHLLPNYGIFEEPRNFDAGSGVCVVEFMGRRIGLSICEDIWALDEETAARYAACERPVDLLAGEGLDVLLNASASLWSPENETARRALLPKVARAVNAPFVYCNLVGGNDEMVCGGGGCALSADGSYCRIMPKFEEAAAVVDIGAMAPCAVPEFDRIAEMYGALKMSLRDFVSKSGFKKVALGLSGGIDSAFVAALAADALGPENVVGVSMPSRFSSDHSVSDAEALARNLGMEMKSVPIAGIVEAAEGALSEIFAGLPRDVAEENLQSRSRGLVLMAISNKLGAMVLATGNKSECAVGYCTLYGDTCGGFAPISDVYKTDVYRLSRYVNRSREIIPENSITKPPSAELRPGQKDSDSLPEYDVLDAVLYAYIEGKKTAAEIAAMGYAPEVVRDALGRFERNEYKRRQLPPGPRVSVASFGVGRRMALSDKMGGGL